MSNVIDTRAWARLTDFITKVTGQLHAGSHYNYNYDNATGNASLKMLGTTYRYPAASEGEGREGCAREAIAKGILYKILEEARPHPARVAELKKLAAIRSNINRLASMDSLFPQTRPSSGGYGNGYQPSPTSGFQGVPPNIQSLSVPAPPSAHERLQHFIADIYGRDCNIFDQIEFAQTREGQSPWSIIIIGRDYLCRDNYADKKAGQEAAVREALEKGALEAMIRDRPPPVNYQTSALELAAKFRDPSNLRPLPAPVPIPSGSRTPLPPQMGAMSPFHAAMAGGASPYQASLMAGAQSPYHAMAVSGGQSPYHSAVMQGGQSPYHMPAQSPYTNGYGMAPGYPNGSDSVSGKSPRRARSSSRRRSRSPRQRSKSRHRSQSRHRSKSKSRRDRSRSRSRSRSTSVSSEGSRTRHRSRRAESRSHRRSKSKRRRSRSDSDGEGRRRKKHSHRRGRSRSKRSRKSTEETEQDQLEPAKQKSRTPPPQEPSPLLPNGHDSATSQVAFLRKDVNQELSPFLDYILDSLEPKAPQIKEDTPEIQISIDEGNQEGRKNSVDAALLARLDSSNREKLHLIRQACRLSLTMQNIRSALDMNVDAGDVVVLPQAWVKEVLQCLSEARQ